MERRVSDVGLFELKQCCETSFRLNQEERISSIGGSSSRVFVGTSHGRIFHLKKHEKDLKVAGNLELQIKREIRQIEFASALDILLVLCDNVLFDILLDSFEILSSRSSVQIMAVNSNPLVNDAFCLQTALATTSKQIHVCERHNSKTETVQKLNTDGVVSAVAFSRLTICFASSGMYNIYHVDSKTVIPLFPFDAEVVRPQISSIETDFLVTGMDGLLISVTEQGVSTRPPLVVPFIAISAIVYNAPYVYVRSSQDIWIVSFDDARISQSLKTEEGKVLRSLDGDIFAASFQNLFTVSMTSLQKQVDVLMSHHKFEEVLALYQRNLTNHFDADSLSNFAALKKNIAFECLKEDNFEKAAELLVSAEVIPEEVVSHFSWPPSKNNSEAWECYQFLEEYLLQIRNLQFALSSRPFIDLCLLKIYVAKDNPEAILSLENHCLDYAEGATFLEDRGYHHYAAELWLRGGDEAKAWAIWRRLSNGELRDIRFKLTRILEHMSGIRDNQVLLDVLSWMITLHPEACMKVILNTPFLDNSKVMRILNDDVKHLRLYLESLPVNEEIAKNLCEIYIKEMISGDNSSRHRFRRILLKISQSDRSAIYNQLPPDYAVERLLCDNSQSAADVLNKVVTIYHDYDAAELVCSHFSPSQPDICLTLLKYMKMDKTADSNSSFDAEARVRSLLKCMGQAVDSRTVIEILPPSIGFEQVSDFLKRAVANIQKEEQIAQSKMALLERSAQLEKANLPNKKIVIEDRTLCPVCKEGISSSDILSYLSTGYVIHTKCMKHESLCPLTNAILTLSE